VTSSAKYRALVMAESASTGCSAANRPMPSSVPMSPLMTASTEEMVPICRFVAPTSRNAA